jgi:hypothetical protein
MSSVHYRTHKKTCFLSQIKVRIRNKNRRFRKPRALNLKRSNFNTANLLVGGQAVAKIPDGHEPNKSQVGALVRNKFGTVHPLFRF